MNESIGNPFTEEYVRQLRRDLARFGRLSTVQEGSQARSDRNSAALAALSVSLSEAIKRSRARAKSLLEAHHLAFEQSPVFCDVTLLAPLGQSRRELSVTQVLAWLLDPKGNHGFGDRMLRGLLRHLADQSEAAQGLLATNEEHITVFSEFAIDSHNRADILVFGRNSALVLEAKVDAKERVNQTLDYEIRFGNHGRQTCFVFLAPHGTDPKSNAFRTIRYLELSRIFIRVLQECTSACGFHYARYFVAGLLRDLSGVLTSSSHSEVLSGDCVKLEILLGGDVA